MLEHNLGLLVNQGTVYDGTIINRELALSLFMDLTYQFTLKTGQIVVGTYRVDEPRRRAAEVDDQVHILAVDDTLHLIL